MVDPLERLKVLLNSSTPVVVMETVEEKRAVMLVRAACAELNLPVFEWSIADGLTRIGGVPVNSVPPLRAEPKPRNASGGSESERLLAHVMSSVGHADATPSSNPCIVNTR